MIDRKTFFAYDLFGFMPPGGHEQFDLNANHFERLSVGLKGSVHDLPYSPDSDLMTPIR